MERRILKKLKAWKDDEFRKPLVLQGARQVGKTWTLKTFGEENFDTTVIINFDNNGEAKALFENGNSAKQFVSSIETLAGQNVIEGSTLLIFDEIQECPKAITSLKYFCEQMPDLHIAAAGSLLGLTIHEGTGFPVGKVNMMHLYPLDFHEFLDAIGKQTFRELIESADFQQLRIFKSSIIEALKQYYYVGGMPEAVKIFSSTNNYERVRAVQRDILETYRLDATKHLPISDTEHILAVWDSIPSHLARENKKFVFSNIADGSRARDYRSAITWLTQAGIAHSVNRITKPGVPITGYRDSQAFKLFMNDVGLLSAVAGLDEKTLINGNKIFQEFKGSLTEQFVCQQLLSLKEVQPFYWSAKNSSGEIDFLIQDKSNVLALEVKAEENLKAKSLAAFSKRYPNVICRRLSLSDFKDQGWMKNIPLYAIDTLTKVKDS